MKYLKCAVIFLLVCIARAGAILAVSLGARIRDLPRRTRRALGYRMVIAPASWRKRLALGLPLLPIAGGATIVGQRSPLFYKKVAGALAVILDGSKYTGNIFYVDSAVGTDGDGYGSTPGAPFATIDYAIGKCTANQGDHIFVLPGHAETINVASGIDADKAGISIIGLGNGEDRPTITIGSSVDTSMVDVGAADVMLKNMIFQPGKDGVDVLISIAADGAIIEDCELRSDEANAYQADTYIQIAGGANVSDRATVRRCKISSITAGAVQAILVTAAQDALVCEDCWIDGDFSAAGIYSTAVLTNAMIRRNAVSNRAAGIHAVEFTAAATGLFIDNRMYGDTLGTILDPGSLKCLGNLETDAVDQAGVDSPRTSAGGLADASITLAAFAADGLQALQDEAEDALEGENLDHLLQLDGATQVYPEQAVADSIIAKIIAKGDPATPSTYSCVTDSQEALSDKLGGFSGDGGAAQDDSAKASMDLAHTDLDAIIADTQYLRTLDGATQVYPENAVADSIIAKMIAKGDPATPSTYSCVTDSQEALSDKLGGFSGDGGAAQDDSVKASLDLAHTDLDAVIADTQYLRTLDGATQVYPENAVADSIIAKMLAKGDPATPSTYSCVTDSQEALSDKMGGFSGDGGAAQDDSAKASLDLAHTDLDAIIADTQYLRTLDGATQVYPENVANDSIIAKLIAKGDPATPSTYSCVTDSLEAASDKLGAFSGDGGAAQDDSAKASLDLAHTDLDSLLAGVERCVEKSDGAVLLGADDLFTITGGPIYAMVVGVVTTVIGDNAATAQLQITTTAPAATANLSTAVSIVSDAAGTSYRFVGATGVLTPDTAGAKIIDPVTVADCWFLLPIGTVKVDCSAANTGVIKWYLRYKSLSPNSVVAAAA